MTCDNCVDHSLYSLLPRNLDLRLFFSSAALAKLLFMLLSGVSGILATAGIPILIGVVE